MVIDKLLEYFQDLKRYYDDKKWGKFYDNYKNDPEEYEGYSNYFHNSYDDWEEAARDLCSEIREYMDLVWNEIPEDQVKLFDDDEKHNVRKWLDETSRMFWNKLDNFSEHETYGFLLQGYKMLKWIENAARKTPDEFYGKYTGGQMPYYLGEALRPNLQESKDYTYIAKIGKGWLKGHDIVYDKKEADSFESETEPTQRINQMKKDGKISKGTYTSVIKETTTMKREDGIIMSLYEAVAEDEDWEYDDSDEIMSDDITDEDFLDEGSPFSYALQRKVMDDDIESAIADTMPTRKPAKKLPYKSTDFPERDVTKHSFIDDEGFIKDVKMFNDRDYYDRTKAKELEKNPNANTEFYDKRIDWYDSHPEDDYLKFVSENDDTVYYPEDDDCPDSSEYAEYFDARSPRRKGGYAHSDVTDFSATKNSNWRDKSYTIAGPYAMTSFQSEDTYDKSGPEEVDYDLLKESKNDDISF